jgi:hypothetical protein
MTSTVTLEQVEALVAQLPATERLKLAARICEQMSATPAALPAISEDEERRRREQEADALLALCDAAAELWQGESDSAEEIRKMRAERDEQLCPSK